MIYVFENPNNGASVVYDETTLTEKDKSKGIAIEQLPIKEEIEGKIAILKCRKSTNEVWYEYEDIPESVEDEQTKKIAELETALLEMTTLNAIQQAQNEQAIMELTMTIGGGM
ncbi:hypothetical protein [Anaerosalibacter sp. Marseille-P3206]|uniref:hypothetical protein n=1 Tax=Anaerosalibacter sp. Marseille-P3206 TaxID=1871005 RepID=UPI000987C05C|nr:hypothetical protein [Anaerosalibacter sp. Marseille-P3206]